MRHIAKIAKSVFLLLAVMLMVSLPITAFAEEVNDESQTYVLDRDANGGFLYLYQSPCMLGYDYNNKYGGNGVPIQAFVFMLYNTLDQSFIPTYCTDIHVTAVKGADYRRLNLEDSTYAGNAAGRIRAILENGFYFTPEQIENDATHRASIQQRLQQLEQASGATNLKAGEAIAATQAAIWRVVHGPVISFPKFSRYTFNPTQTKYSDLCYEGIKSKSDASINETIEKVYEYLLSLDPIPAETKAVSASSFVELHDPVLKQNDDGSYDVTVTTVVNVDMADVDELTLKASLNGTYVASVNIHNGRQEVTLTLTNVPAHLASQEVKLTLFGYQTVEGYFLFDASGDRGSSQTMVGYDNSRLPVYAEVRAEESRVLKIQKGTSTFRPISDIVFNIYYVSSLEESGSLPDAEDHPYANNNTQQCPNYSVITDDNGFASLNFTQHGLKDGVYLIVEEPNPKVVAPIAPFYLSVPHTDGASVEYQITLYPKNELVDEWVPQVGGIRLLKVDAADNNILLSGAQFQVYRVATQNEVAAGSGVTIPGINGKAIPVTFFTNESMTGAAVTSVTSGNNGSICIYGLDYGTYYLLETSAPDGYNLLNDPIEIVIGEDSYTGPPLMIENKYGLILPETGGIGTTVYTMTGAALVCVACMLLYLHIGRSKKEQ